MDLRHFIWIYTNLIWIYIAFNRFCIDYYGFVRIHISLNGLMLFSMRFNILRGVVDVFMSLVWPASVPQALFPGKKKHSRIC